MIDLLFVNYGDLLGDVRATGPRQGDMMQLAKPVIDASPALCLAVNADFHSSIDPAIKARLFVLVRACAQGRANAEAHKAGLAKQAALIPSFAAFRQLCMEDLTEAFHEDRHSAARAQKNRRRVWLDVFKSFARLRGIKQHLKIGAIDHSGHYTCELIDAPAPDRWEQWFRMGRRLGVTEAQMMSIYQGAGALDPCGEGEQRKLRVSN